jgi:hypothetical protein
MNDQPSTGKTNDCASVSMKLHSDDLYIHYSLTHLYFFYNFDKIGVAQDSGGIIERDLQVTSQTDDNGSTKRKNGDVSEASKKTKPTLVMINSENESSTFALDANCSGSPMEQHQHNEVIDLTSDDQLSICQVQRRNFRYYLRDKCKSLTEVNPTSISGARRNCKGALEVGGKVELKIRVEAETGVDGNVCNDTGGEAEEDSERNSKTEDTNKTESKHCGVNDSDSESSLSSDSDEDLDKKPTAKNGLSAYEQLRAERIKRNIAKLVSQSRKIFSFFFLRSKVPLYFCNKHQPGVTWIFRQTKLLPTFQKEISSQVSQIAAMESNQKIPKESWQITLCLRKDDWHQANENATTTEKSVSSFHW